MAGGATTIRTLLEFGWCRDDHGILIARVKADAFCHSMVRALVGACAAVGEGRLKIADVAAIRDGGVRTSDVKVLAAAVSPSPRSATPPMTCWAPAPRRRAHAAASTPTEPAGSRRQDGADS
jgi:hypothetical protein